LLTVLRTDENRSVCLIAMFLLSTGARLNEALQATWDQIDQKNRVWKIPATVSKSKHVRSVPLNDAALDIINQLDTEGKFDYLFVNRQTGKAYTTIHKVWDRLRRKAGLKIVCRLHDLRHSYASFLVNSGRTLFEVQQILGHSDPKISMRRLESPPVPMASMLVPRCTSRESTVRSIVSRTTPPKAAPTKNSQM
jgi:integrase